MLTSTLTNKPPKAGAAMSFLLLSNVLDMALAAAECAAGLDDGPSNGDARAAAAKFFRSVRYNMVFEETCGPTEHFFVFNGDMRGSTFHPQFLREARDCHALLKTCAPLSDKTRFKNGLERLEQKILEGDRLSKSWI